MKFNQLANKFRAEQDWDTVRPVMRGLSIALRFLFKLVSDEMVRTAFCLTLTKSAQQSKSAERKTCFVQIDLTQCLPGELL